MKLLETIEVWIREAKAREMHVHLKHFWTVRDILEGILHVPDKYRNEAIEFIRYKCKPSQDRTEIINYLYKKACGDKPQAVQRELF